MWTDEARHQYAWTRRKGGLRLTDPEWALTPKLNECIKASLGLPPEKWSSLRYGFGPCGGQTDVEEKAQA